MKPERRQEIEQDLLAAGVPPDVVRYALKQSLQPWLYLASLPLLMLLMLGGFSVGGLYLWPALEQLTEQNARRHAEDAGALLYDYNFGLSLVVAIFAWIFASGVILSIPAMLSRRALATTFVFSIVDSKYSSVTQWGLGKLFQQLGAETSPASYMRNVVLGWTSWFAGAALALSAISGLALWREVQAHTLFTPTAFVRAPFFPWGSAGPHPYSSAVSVEVGCNHVERRGKISDDIIYQIRFPHGDTPRIGDAIPVRGEWLDAAETIDAQVVASRVPFSKWNWLGRDPQHPDCLASLWRRFPPQDYDRLRRLLRLEQ